VTILSNCLLTRKLSHWSGNVVILNFGALVNFRFLHKSAMYSRSASVLLYTGTKNESELDDNACTAILWSMNNGCAVVK
jgi:hypothetical protein